MCKIQKLIALLILFNAQYYLRATEYFVTSPDDSGPGSLREKLEEAVYGDSIAFKLPSPYTVFITSGSLIMLLSNVTIYGTNDDGNQVIIDGSGMPDGAGPLFKIINNINTGPSVELLINLIIQNGMGGNGTVGSPNGGCGGIQIVNSSNFTILTCSIINCHANGNSGSEGSIGEGGVGGISIDNNSHNITIGDDVTVQSCSGNGGNVNPSSPGNGGNGGTGGISIAGENITINNSIIENNSANGGTTDIGTYGTGGVGGVFLSSGSSNNTLHNVEILSNQANDGFGASPAGTFVGVSAINISDSSFNTIENSNIAANSVTSRFGSTIIVQGGSNSNSIVSNIIQANTVIGIGAPGISITGASNSNLISLNTLADNISGEGTISVENNSILNSILSNTIFNNTPPIPITLATGGNNDQQAPTNISAMACPCGAGGAWQLIVSGAAPAAASGGTGEILINAFFNTLSEPGCNTYVGSFQVPAGLPFTNQTLPIVSVSDITGFLSLTATNSNGTNPPSTRAPGDVWGDTSMLSDQAVVVVS